MRPYFTPDQDTEIASRYTAGESTVQLARAFGTGHYNILAALSRTGTERRRPGARPAELAPKWRGGARIKNNHGYVMIYAHPDDELAQAMKPGSRPYVLEHRLVMARHLGRALGKEERVHHLNGVRDDNRIENLELWDTAHPAGQRPHQRRHCPTCSCRAISWTEE